MWVVFKTNIKHISVLSFHGHTKLFEKLESFCDSPANSCRAAYDLECSLGLDYAIPALLCTRPLEIADFGVLKASLPFRSRGTILPVNYLGGIKTRLGNILRAHQE